MNINIYIVIVILFGLGFMCVIHSSTPTSAPVLALEPEPEPESEPSKPEIQWETLYVGIRGVKEDLIVNYNPETELDMVNKFKEDFASKKEILKIETNDGWLMARSEDIIYIAAEQEDK